jgi:hypothetical protein
VGSSCFLVRLVSHKSQHFPIRPTFGLRTREVVLLRRTQDRKTNVFGRSVHRPSDGFQCAVAPHGTVNAPS